MSKKVAIAGVEYEYKGVTDLELAVFATKVFGTEPPPEGSSEYKDWFTQFVQRFGDYDSQRALAHFLRCAFPDIPDSVVKYQVRREPDGTEICEPGRHLRVQVSARELEQIIKTITPELTQAWKTQEAQATSGAGDKMAVSNSENQVSGSDGELSDEPPSGEDIERALALLKRAQMAGSKGFGKQIINK